jgi:nucleoside-diphosphate-sugar epimerase
MSSRDCIIIGGGYLSTHLEQQLLQTNPDRNVHVYGLESENKFDIRLSSDYEKVRSLCDGAIIYLLASISSDSLVDQYPTTALETNIEGLLGFIKFLYQYCKPYRVIFTSSEWVYARNPKDILDTDPKFSISSYGRQKLLGELLLIEYGKAYQITTIICRLGIVWGLRTTGGACEAMAELVKEAYLSKKTVVKVGNAESARRFTHVKDISFALSRFVTGSDTGIYDICSPECTTLARAIGICSRYFGVSITVESLSSEANVRCIPRDAMRNPAFTWSRADFETRMQEHLRDYYPLH